MIHNHRKGVVMSSLWRQSRSLRNKSKLFSATINKSKKPKSPVGNFFDFIKQWWVLISVGSFALMIALLVGGYSSVFSGDIGASIEYVQAYVSNGYYKIAVYSILVILLFAVMVFVPAHASLWWFEEKWHKKPKLKGILWTVAVYAICILVALFAGFICNFLSGGFYIFFIIWAIISVTYFIFLLPIPMSILCRCGVEKERRRFWVAGSLIALMVIVTLWQPANVLLLINGGNDTGYMACVSGNRNIDGKSEFFKKTIIPVSYDSRGVQVFAGDYNDKTKRWTNIRREYLYFNEGYKVRLGEACPKRAEGK